ncbi:hypothetical protein BG006_008658 [Podila minutissima]|uniref:Uncharacterized protein n=1 Tax=Podila minutissima TaxID=64525 RepID=A0A9P5SFL9_9FUNG|nr:hypothetical protein BG006_008658 [Podila minutissima]
MGGQKNLILHILQEEMHSSIVFVGALLASLVAVQAGPIQGGSWCNQPKNEPFWGAASANCCKGWMDSNRRCHDIPDCRAFYTCCINNWHSNNKPTDHC